jgi:hypothetical protein
MVNRTGLMLAAGSLVVGLVVAPGTAFAATSCTATTLPNPADRPHTSGVIGTNGNGVHIGSVTPLGGGDESYVVWRNGGVERLDKLSPTAMNNNGLMLGTVKNADGTSSAALQPLDGAVKLLADGNRRYTSGMNNLGHALGEFSGGSGPGTFQTAYRWTNPDASPQSLGASRYNAAYKIDDLGWVVGGWSTYGAGDGADAIWNASGGVQRSYPNGGNPRISLVDVDNGQVAASRYQSGVGWDVVVIDAASGAITPVPGSAEGRPIAITNGVIVGYSPNGPTMWRNGQAILLPAAPGSVPWEASFVNAGGTEIVGLSTVPSGGRVTTVWRCTH